MSIKNKIYYIAILLLLIQGCSFKPCEKKLVGRYNNLYDSNAINYLDLNADGTYYHYYKKDKIILSVKGNWEKIDKPNCSISLKNWENYNEKGLDYDKFAHYVLIVNGDCLNPGFDGDVYSSFKKGSNSDQVKK